MTDMNIRLHLSCAAMALALTSMAGPLVSGFPPPAAPAGQPATTDAPSRAPLNPTMGYGTKLFGATCVDYDKLPRFTDIWSERPLHLEKKGTVLIEGSNEEDYPTMYIIGAGCWTGDAYYAYKIRTYSFGIIMPDSWIRVDPQTGSYEKLEDLYETPLGKKWEYTYDLAWNPKTDEVIGLQQSSVVNDRGSVTSKISLIDTANGEAAGVVKNFDEYYFSIAFDYDGMLYGIRWDYNENSEIIGTVLDVFDPEDNYEITRTKNLTVDGRSFRIYYQNSLTFDYTTGDLWWAATNADGNQALVYIDPQQFSTVNKGQLGMNESVVGLYAPYVTADSRTAPARVENMSFATDASGADRVTVKWTNPSKTWNRRNLSDLKEILIYRDSYEGEPVARVNASGMVGKAMSWRDESASQGIHTYYVTACAREGEKGIVNSIEAFVGRDVPGPVENLSASTADGKSITLTWDRPSRGDNDGWFDADALKYTVTRLPDNKIFETSETALYDVDIPEAQGYSYTVVASNSDGEGSPVTSNQVLAGKSVLIPFLTSFETKVDADRFTAIDKNGDGMTFDYDLNYNRMRNTMHFLMSNHSNDDVLVSPPLNVKKGSSYKVTYGISIGCFGTSDRRISHHFRFIGGNAPTADGMTDVYGELKDYVKQRSDKTFYITDYFTAPEDGDYHVGLEVLTSGETDLWMYVEEFEISEMKDIDLTAMSLKTYLNLSTVEDNIFEVEIFNNGLEAQQDYKVQVAAIDRHGEPAVFAETADVPLLEPRTSAVVQVKGKAPLTGELRIAGIVDIENDGNDFNNRTESTAVKADEGYAFNTTVDSEKYPDARTTQIPFNHYSMCTASQTIYTQAMTGLKAAVEGGVISVKRLAWEYIGASSFGNTEINVYLSDTDRQGYDPEEGKFIPVSSQPLFSGTVDVEETSSYIVADLDEPFSFEPEMGLVVTVTKREQGHADFLMRFRSFDENWYNEEFHSVSYGGNEDFTPATPGGFRQITFPEAPVLHLTVDGASGVEEIALVGEGSVWYDSSLRAVVSNNVDISSVEAYDLAGRRAAYAAGRPGCRMLTVECPEGIHIIRAVTADGKTVSFKVNIR